MLDWRVMKDMRDERQEECGKEIMQESRKAGIQGRRNERKRTSYQHLDGVQE